MTNVAINLEINNQMTESEAEKFQQEKIVDVITMIRSEWGHTIILKNEGDFKVEYKNEKDN
ncbi:TPA: hypothetical protein I1665_000403 [Staphylococcus pseudintermedius]|nr:hypothetical protein [Staphylococcus pseudintermedius]